jgi:hypothetical protein
MRWSRTSRRGRAHFSAPLMLSTRAITPIVSNEAPYQKPESSEERCEP